MRRALAFLLLISISATLACYGKGKRNLRPENRQIYDLPSADEEWTTKPPTYPKRDGLTPPTNSKNPNTPQNLRGIGGAGAGGGIGNGAPGAGIN